jgi:chromatin segregation and condensation protein Rec8/ScpA/Scc1 (kleisin family)
VAVPAPLPQQDPGLLAVAFRRLAAEPPTPSLGHLGTFPPVARFLERFRALLKRRRDFSFDDEVDGLSRVEQAVAFLALLELRKRGEATLRQAAPFEPISVCTSLTSA